LYVGWGFRGSAKGNATSIEGHGYIFFLIFYLVDFVDQYNTLLKVDLLIVLNEGFYLRAC
jgi:hypothetical protein